MAKNCVRKAFLIKVMSKKLNTFKKISRRKSPFMCYKVLCVMNYVLCVMEYFLCVKTENPFKNAFPILRVNTFTLHEGCLSSCVHSFAFILFKGVSSLFKGEITFEGIKNLMKFWVSIFLWAYLLKNWQPRLFRSKTNWHPLFCLNYFFQSTFSKHF